MADIVIPKDSISVSCEKDSCQSALTHTLIQKSLSMLNIYFEISNNREFQRVAPGKLNLVTPNALN